METKYPLIIFVLVFLFNFLWIFQGFDVTDTGHHLTTQVLTFSPNPSDKVTFSVFLSNFAGGFWLWLYGSPSLLWSRLGGCMIMSLNAVIVFLILRQYFDQKNSFYVVLSSSFLLSAFTIKMIHYYTFPSFLSTLWLYFLSKALKGDLHQRLYGFMTGFMIVPIILSRFPLISILLIPPVLLFYLKLAKADAKGLKKAFLYGFFGFVLSVMVFWAIYSFIGISVQYIVSVTRLFDATDAGYVSSKHSVDSLFNRLIRDTMSILKLTVFASTASLPLLIIKSRFKGRKVDLVILILLLAAFAVYEQHLSASLLRNRTVRLLAGLMGFVGLIYAANDKTEKKHISLILLASIGLMLISSLGSASGMRKAHYGMWVALPLMILCFESLCSRFRRAPFRDGLRIDFRVIVVFLIILSVYFHYSLIYRDMPRPHLNTQFEHPYLRHILSNPERVRVVDEVLVEMGERTQKGDEILAVNGIPMMYYLTENRPAIGRPWFFLDSLPQIQRQVSEGVEKGNFPKLFIYSKVMPSDPNWPETNRTVRDQYAEKLEYVKYEFIDRLNYTLAWENEAFAIYEPPENIRG